MIARGPVEVLFWSLVMAVMTGLSFTIVATFVGRWLEAPLIWTVTEDRVPVTEVLFPAVTVCVQQVGKIYVRVQG